MYTNELLDAYKKAKNYIQDKQVAHDLGLSRQKISAIRNGQRYLTENEALFLAREIGADTESVLVYLAADKAKTFEAQQEIVCHCMPNLMWIGLLSRLDFKIRRFLRAPLNITAIYHKIPNMEQSICDCWLCY